MYLDAASRFRELELPPIGGNGSLGRSEIFGPWAKLAPSRISHHGKPCCEAARRWLLAADFARLGEDDVFSGPRWLRNLFAWGPSCYPVFWCEAVRRERLDCGALAALAHEIFNARGVRCFRAQLVQQFSETAASQWAAGWAEAGVPAPWIDRDRIYHEGCAVLVRDREIRVWDPSAGWWIDPRKNRGYGSLLAIRVTACRNDLSFDWEGRAISPNRWQPLQA